jgi:hypothetical protein
MLEEAVHWPAKLSKHAVPRRGGVKVPVRKFKPQDRALIFERRDGRARELLEQLADRVPEERRSDPVLVAAGRAHLDGEPSVLGAAVVAGLTASLLTYAEQDKLPVLAEHWLEAHGPVFAARAAVELAGIEVVKWASVPEPMVRRTGQPRPAFGSIDTTWHALARWVRVRLVDQPGETLRDVVTALERYRAGSLMQRIITSYLVPEQTAWVDADCALLGTATAGGFEEARMLAASITRADQLAVLARLRVYEANFFDRTVATLLDGVGPALAPQLDAWLDEPKQPADTKRLLLSVLAGLPTDEALGALIRRYEDKATQPYLVTAMGRYPARALRLLAGSGGRGVAELLRLHVLGHQELAKGLLAGEVPAGLPEAAAKRVRAALGVAESTVPVAPDEALPPLLVRPPWTVERPAPRVVPLTVPAEAAMAWLPGERDAWLAERGDPPTYPGDYADLAASAEPESLHVELLEWGPDQLARPVAARWRPRDAFQIGRYARIIAARFELDVLPTLRHLAKQAPVAAVPALMPYAASELVPVMLDLLGKKNCRAPALAWLNRHPNVAARSLIPAALGTPGELRRTAEHLLVTLGDAERVRAVAASFGTEAVEAITELLHTDPAEVLPPVLRKLPDWVDATVLPPVLLRDGSGRLPTEAVQHLVTMLAMARLGEPHAGWQRIRETLDPASVAELGWTLFQRWERAGKPAREGWALEALALTGDDNTVRGLSPLIQAWPGQSAHARAVTGLDVLAAIGSELALVHLHRIAEKVKFPGLRERATGKVAEIAGRLGLTPEQLADRVVPDFGLDPDGSLVLDYGPRRFTVGFDEQLKPYVLDADGSRRKELPKPGAKDDPQLAPRAHQHFAALKKDVRAVAGDLIRRFEQAMLAQRRWTGAEFTAFFVAHPLVWHITRRLVWRAGTPFRVAEDRTLANLADERYELPADALIGLVHPAQLSTDELAAWRQLFADYAILQPFAQLGREVHRLTDAERAATDLHRYVGVEAPTKQLIRLDYRGWRRTEPGNLGVQHAFERPTPTGLTITVGIKPGVVVGNPYVFDTQTITEVRARRADGTPAPLGDLDPVTASELLRVLRETLGGDALP